VNILIFIVLLIASDRIWRLLDATKKHNAKVETILAEINDRLGDAGAAD